MTVNKIYWAALIGVMAAVTAVISVICIPTPFGVPITLQVLGVALCGFLLGRKGTVAVLVFLALAALGMPVLAGFRGGIGEFFSPTGGFLWGFPILAFLCGFGDDKRKKYPFAMFGLALCYVLGAAKFAASAGSADSLFWLLPCFLKDVVLLFLAGYIATKLQRKIKRF